MRVSVLDLCLNKKIEMSLLLLILLELRICECLCYSQSSLPLVYHRCYAYSRSMTVAIATHSALYNINNEKPEFSFRFLIRFKRNSERIKGFHTKNLITFILTGANHIIGARHCRSLIFK